MLLSFIVLITLFLVRGLIVRVNKAKFLKRGWKPLDLSEEMTNPKILRKPVKEIKKPRLLFKSNAVLLVKWYSDETTIPIRKFLLTDGVFGTHLGRCSVLTALKKFQQKTGRRYPIDLLRSNLWNIQ